MRRASLNHAYRLVWSDIFNAFVPVPEWAKAKGKRSRGGLAAAVLVAGAALSPAAMAQTWVGTTGDWFDSANWDTNVVPTAPDDTIIGNGGTAQILSGDSAASSILSVQGASTMTVEGTLAVGNSLYVPNGSIDILAGGVMDVYWGYLGGDMSAGNPATVTVEGTLNGPLTLNQGTVTVQNGGLFTGSATVSGYRDSATIRVTGAGSAWDDSAGGSTFEYGASLAVENGGLVTTPGFSFYTASSSVTLDDGTLRLSANSTEIFNDSFAIPTVVTLGAGGGTFDTQGFTVATDSAISGTGELTKTGTGTLTLTGANTYSGGTTVSAGTLAGTTTSLQGDIDNNAAVVFNQATTGTYAGVMSGTGTLTKQGTGNVTLSGANTYSGGTTVSGGTLTGTTTSLQGDIVNNAAVVFDQSSDGGYGSVMSGSGTLTKSGAGNLLLSGPNTYSGGTTVSGGKLTGSTDSLQGNIVNNAAVVFDQSSDGTYAGSMSGTGSLANIYMGTVTLSGVNTYSGTTTITGSKLIASGGSAIGDLSAVITESGTLELAASETIGSLAGAEGNVVLGAHTLTAGGNNTSTTFGGVLSGTGGLTKTGSGTLTLSGANTYSGGTTVSGGTLTGTTTSLQGAITNNAAVVFNQSTDGTYAGVMSGTGSLTKSGAGSVTLSGMNTYAGATAVDAGRLVVTGSNAIADTAAVTVAAGAQFEMAQTETIGSLTGAGEAIINPGAITVGGNNASTTFSGVMSGLGSMYKAGTGTLTLSGANTRTGMTHITGGTLRVEGGSALGDGANVVVHTGATLALGASETIGALDGAGSVNLGGNTLTAGGGNGSTTFSGVASGTGGLVKTGTGNLTLSGANTYSGGTTVSAGTLTGTTTSLQGAITNNAAVVFNQGTDGTYAGVMSGSGMLTKQGTGNVTLTGANTYSGGTTISGGTLQIGAGGTTGSIGGAVENNGTLTFNRSDSVFDPGVISGSGALVKNGSGVLVIASDHTYTGVTNVNSGVLYIGNGGTTGSIAGDMVNNAAVAFMRTDSLSYSGDISGSGSLAVWEGGEITLSGSNSYTGGTGVGNGVLIANGGSAIGDSSAVTVGSGSTLALGASETIGSLAGAGSVTLGANTLTAGGDNSSTTFSGVASGTGALVKTGSGTLTLSGANTYSGGTTVSGGTLTGSTTSLQGAITNNAAVVFDQGTDGTYAGVMSGTGSLTKSGSGMLTLTGTSTLSGATTVSAGTLRVNGALDDSEVTVADGAWLDGIGSIGGLWVQDGATVAPGNSIGTLEIAGDVTFDVGSVYEVEVDADGSHDLLDASGSATLNGGTVSVLAGPSDNVAWGAQNSYTILTADGGVTGTFAEVIESNLAFLDPTLSYDANNVYLMLTRNDIAFGEVGRNPNEVAVGDALSAIFTDGSFSGEMGDLINTLTGLSTTDAQRALQTLSGGTLPNVATILGNAWRAVHARTTELGTGPRVSGESSGDAADGVHQWGEIFGAGASVDSQGTITGLDGRQSGAILGIDGTLDSGLRLGVSLAYVLEETEFDLVADEFDTRSVYLTGRSGGDVGDMSWSALFAVGSGGIDTTREVVVGPDTFVATGETDSLDLRAYGELVRAQGAGAIGFAPVLGVGAGRTTVDAFTETGAGPANLSVEEETYDSLTSHAGLRLRLPSDKSSAVVEAEAMWVHEFGDVAPVSTMSFASDPIASFTVYGAELARDSAQARVRVSAEPERGMKAYVEGNGDWRDGARAFAIVVGFNADW